jgi:hypothetical protein
MEVKIGGNRLGSGNKMKAYMHNYERSSHDLGYVWRSTMSAGTLVPFMSQVALPGDTFDIDLTAETLTHPTIGPLFGNYKQQLDVFQIPIRLYQPLLHMNMLGIGRDMSSVKLPRIEMEAGQIVKDQDIDNQQINPSSIFAYLGIRGVGTTPSGVGAVTREFNAIPYLGYWDIYKNYYANKQEEVGMVIHKGVATLTGPNNYYQLTTTNSTPILNIDLSSPPITVQTVEFTIESTMTITTDGLDGMDVRDFLIEHTVGTDPTVYGMYLVDMWDYVRIIGSDIICSGGNNALTITAVGQVYYQSSLVPTNDDEPRIQKFSLDNIDQMRLNLLTDMTSQTTGYKITNTTISPYGLALEKNGTAYSKKFSQEGLGLKTYNSDLFNNWISTEWIDGVDGVSAVTAIDTSGGSFTIDELNLSKKVYNMLNRIAISGGSYDDWLDAVYTHERKTSIESPVYLGGLIRNVVFQEVVSTADTKQVDGKGDPLGTLAGRGKMGNLRKGGHIVVKVDEPSYILGICSLTPLVDYSQGNQWDVNLMTMNDFHKPALDEIGFQDLVTDQMAWWETRSNAGVNTYRSAGKQPAWINYMTNVNQVRGNFAIQSEQMYMTLNRRYTVAHGASTPIIEDLTTYIDPVKFNHIFADTRRDAQNFWVQIGVNMTARRKMSAKVIPNL